MAREKSVTLSGRNARHSKMQRIRSVVREIARKFDPNRIILFGSYANGNPRDDSDVDLLVILPFAGQGFRKSLEILDAVDPGFSIDLLTSRPDEIERRFSEGDPLIRSALAQGKILYERHG